MNFSFKRFLDIPMSDLSTYRSQLMGFSILMIMLFHSGVLTYGNIGVDFFLCISAIGIYFSYQKNPKTWAFYKRRLIRILPAYFVFTIPYIFQFKHYNPGATTADMLKLLFQVRTLTETFIWSQWFIGLILLCYFFTPLIFKYRKTFLSTQFLVVFTFFCFLLTDEFKVFYLIERFPIYLCSLKFASYVYEHKKINLVVLLLPLLLVIGLYPIIQPWFMEHSLNFDILMCMYFCCTFPLLSLLARMFSVFPKVLNNIMGYLGKISFELYLCHECLCLFPIREYMPVFEHSTLVVNVVSILAAILLSAIAHELIAYIVKQIQSFSKPTTPSAVA